MAGIILMAFLGSLEFWMRRIWRKDSDELYDYMYICVDM